MITAFTLCQENIHPRFNFNCHLDIDQFWIIIRNPVWLNFSWWSRMYKFTMQYHCYLVAPKTRWNCNQILHFSTPAWLIMRLFMQSSTALDVLSKDKHKLCFHSVSNKNKSLVPCFLYVEFLNAFSYTPDIWYEFIVLLITIMLLMVRYV